jgi:hypothetical protein
MSIVVQLAINRFKHGRMNLEWRCPFCGDQNQWELSGLPPVVIFSDAIPCFCHGCRKDYAIAVRQKLTGVVSAEMSQ